MWNPFKKNGATVCDIFPGITCNGDCKNCDTWKDFQAPYKQKPAPNKHTADALNYTMQAPYPGRSPYFPPDTNGVDKQEPMGYDTPIPQCWLNWKED